MDDKEEYLKINNIKIQINPNKSANFNDIAKTIPKNAATPFPPLNFNHTGKI